MSHEEVKACEGCTGVVLARLLNVFTVSDVTLSLFFSRLLYTGRDRRSRHKQGSSASPDRTVPTEQYTGPATAVLNHILANTRYILALLACLISHLLPSLQLIEKFGRGAIGGESQQQRYVCSPLISIGL